MRKGNGKHSWSQCSGKVIRFRYCWRGKILPLWLTVNSRSGVEERVRS
jgi:hypothetical protein